MGTSEVISSYFLIWVFQHSFLSKEYENRRKEVRNLLGLPPMKTLHRCSSYTKTLENRGLFHKICREEEEEKKERKKEGEGEVPLSRSAGPNKKGVHLSYLSHIMGRWKNML